MISTFCRRSIGTWGRYSLAAWVVAVLFAMSGSTGFAQQDGTADAPTILITGSNRGIGLEFTRQYAVKGWRVIATCRTPSEADALNELAAEHSNITIEKLDVTDFEAIDSLAAKYAGTPIDVLLNNAGISGGRENQLFGDLKYDVFYDVMHVNVRGPLKMAESFIEHVKASNQKKIINITSSEGSISTVVGSGGYFYRASKASLNMMSRNLSKHLKGQGVIVGLVNPGPVDTDMMKNFPFHKMTPEESVGGMVQVIENYTLETTGMFLHYNGDEITW